VVEAIGLQPWFWLGGSLLLALLATWTMWWLERAKERDLRIASFLDGPVFPILVEIGRLLFYLGVPFAALLWGRDAVIGRLMGLQPLLALNGLAGDPAPAAEVAANLADWVRDVGWTAGLGAAAWAVLALGWWTVRRGTNPPRLDDGLLSGAVGLREAAYHEVHWAFYRNAPIVALGPYWGTWAGLGLAALEAVLNPFWRAGLRDADRASLPLLRAGMAFVSAALFLKTGNLWLAILVHWGVLWGLSATANSGFTTETQRAQSNP
jgi:hypothetical protein